MKRHRRSPSTTQTGAKARRVSDAALPLQVSAPLFHRSVGSPSVANPDCSAVRRTRPPRHCRLPPRARPRSQPSGKRRAGPAARRGPPARARFAVRSIEPSAEQLSVAPRKRHSARLLRGSTLPRRHAGRRIRTLASVERSRRRRQRSTGGAVDQAAVRSAGGRRTLVRTGRLRHEGRDRRDASRRRSRAGRRTAPGPVVYQSVIEECGGNGALAACLEGPWRTGSSSLSRRTAASTWSPSA